MNGTLVRTLAAALSGFALASILAVAAAPPARADIAEDIKGFEEYLKTNPESQALRNKIADLALKRKPEVAKALIPLLQSSKYDDDVKITVCQNIGKQGYAPVGGMLMNIADSKENREKPKLVAAALEGVGDADAKHYYDDLMKMAKKYLDMNGDIACAGFRAASLNVESKTVDDMIKALDVADYVTTQDNAQKKAARGAAKPVLIDILKKLTGENIDDTKIWHEWWKKNKANWKPPAPGAKPGGDINASNTYSDAAYGYEITKANRAWIFRKGEQGELSLTIEALEDGQQAAWIQLFTFGTKNYNQKTPEAMAKTWKDANETKFRDLKSQKWEEKCSYGGVKGVEQFLDGQHKEFDAVHMHNVFLEKGEVMYYMVCVYKSGKKKSFEQDIEEMLRSFKITR